MKTPMKMLMACLFLAFTMSVSGQDDYTQYETIYLKPDNKSLGTLSTNMKAHNDKYHSDETYHANVWQVSNGPKSGWLVWSMGPCTFSHLDNRPAADGHDEDWANNVMPYVTDMGSIEYWRLDEERSKVGDPQPMLYIRFWQIRPGKGFMMGDHWDKISATYKSMGDDVSWALYENEFRQGALGRHFAEINPMANWGDLDVNRGFRAAYEKLHGNNAWTPFIRTSNEIFLDAYDEIWTLMPDMSAPPPEN